MDYNKGTYQPLQQCLDDQQEHDVTRVLPNFKEPTPASKKGYICIILFVTLAVSNVVLIWHEVQHIPCRDPLPYWGSDTTIMKPFYWTTEYSSENKTDTTPLWNGLFPIGDGLVTLPDEWAATQKLPNSIKRYKNSTESIYFVAAYHQLHCLTIIRSVLYNLKEGVELGVPFVHATHCLDSLRQSTMCHADDTLLYTEDTHSYGDGQSRVCKDWDSLVLWTKEHRIFVSGMEGM